MFHANRWIQNPETVTDFKDTFQYITTITGLVFI